MKTFQKIPKNNKNFKSKRRINFKVPTATDHREYTVTERCYFIEAGNPCPGCTMVKVQRPEKEVFGKDGKKMNVKFVKSIAQKQVNEGINLLTYMGGDPLTYDEFAKVVHWTTDHPTLIGLVYSPSIYFIKGDGFSKRFYLFEKAGLFTPNYFLCSVDKLIFKRKQLKSGSSDIKSFLGLKLAKKLVDSGYEDIAIHQTIREDSIDFTLDLYKWAVKNNVLFSFCPMVWKPYMRGPKADPDKFFKLRLKEKHTLQLQEIIDYLIKEETKRLRKGMKRSLIPSSAFLRLMPKFGPNNFLNCKNYRKKLRPNGHDVHPNGEHRWCIAQNLKKDCMKCGGCYYIGIDRGKSDYWHFEELAGPFKKGDLRWLNYHVWKKDPNFDPTRENIVFEAA